jgi:hypothetical protein
MSCQSLLNEPPNQNDMRAIFFKVSEEEWGR